MREDVPLGPMTTLGVGGPARWYAEPRDEAELAAVLRELGGRDLLVVGRGSNLLVGDRGWPGVAVRLGAGFKAMSRDGLLVTAGGGASMPALAAWLAAEGLAGLEFAAGIPATVGGSVRMNAGAHGGQTADRLVSFVVASPEAPEGRRFESVQARFAYRHSELPPRSVVTSATWLLEEDDPAALRARLDELRAWRRATQPLRQRNCGSVFTNPPGESAGRLIDAVGLKGHRRGSAFVSPKHANFFQADEGGSADDVRGLIEEVRQRVEESTDISLVPELRMVGFE